MKFFTKEVQIACAAILALVVLYFGLNFLKERLLQFQLLLCRL